LQSELSSAAAKASEEREFLRSLNETLLANQKDFGAKLQQAQAAMADKDAQLQDLQEQVRIMAQLSVLCICVGSVVADDMRPSCMKGRGLQEKALCVQDKDAQLQDLQERVQY
jgi:hypothetical protein